MLKRGVEQQRGGRTYAGLRVVPGSPRVLVVEGLAVLTLRPRPAVAAVVAYAATGAARGLESGDVKVAGLRVTAAVTS